MYGIDSYYDLFLNAKNIPKRINQSIEINGKTVKLFLLEDKEIMELQFEKIRQYTEQAAGRARALREQGAKVYFVTILCRMWMRIESI